MPGDARVDIIHKPSYAIAAVAIHAHLHRTEIFDDELNAFFRSLLEGTFRNGIIGHGIDHPETVRRTMLMLCKAGLKEFLDADAAQYPAFSKAMYQHMESFEAMAKRIDEEHCVFTANGFSPDSVNHLIKELVAYWNGNTHPVFVYGTLMRGQRANHMLSSGDYAGCFHLKDHAMYDLGSYPGIKPCDGESVLGELYFVSPAVVVQLDQYEGEGYLYDRTSVTVQVGSSTYPAEAYVYKKDVSTYKKMRERWDAAKDDLVWYAGYGSNLSSDRFSCYISGGTCAENGRTYTGSSDPTPPRAVQKRSFPGTLYFGNNSSSWGGCGVAFFDPAQKDVCSTVHMKLYLITRQQLHDVMRQEGPSANWYGRLICLEVDNQGIPVYTLTSETHRPETAPATAYTDLIAEVLQKEFKLGKRQIQSYFKRWH